jgi:hypothetical protein
MRYCVPENIIDRDIGEELLIHHFEKDEVFILNSDARLIFQALKRFGDPEEVREAIASEVFGDRLELDRAVDDALQRMVAEGMIVPDEAPGN